MKTVALDHRNKIVSAAISAWDTRVRRWYSTTSNKSQRIVAPPTTAAEVFVSFHNSTSAAEQRNADKTINYGNGIRITIYIMQQQFGLKFTSAINTGGLLSKEKLFTQQILISRFYFRHDQTSMFIQL
jgi:hypothetical protein